MEAACKAAWRSAQLLNKDSPEEEVSQMLALMASVKEQLGKVGHALLSVMALLWHVYTERYG